MYFFRSFFSWLPYTYKFMQGIYYTFMKKKSFLINDWMFFFFCFVFLRYDLIIDKVILIWTSLNSWTSDVFKFFYYLIFTQKYFFFKLNFSWKFIHKLKWKKYIFENKTFYTCYIFEHVFFHIRWNRYNFNPFPSQQRPHIFQ